jgi:hypothetical protein
MFGAIQGAFGWGRRRAMPKAVFAPTRRRRSPVPTLLLLLLVLLVGLLVFAYTRHTEVAPTRIEQDVTNELAH